MLELREYTVQELSQTLNTNGKQATDRKLRSWGIGFESEGYGNRLKYRLTSFASEFRIFCILELGFSPQCDFNKLRNFFYAYLNDEEFMAMPDEVKETRLKAMDKGISRQTIANWEYKLEAQNLIHRSTTDFIYYFAHKGEQRMCDKKEYCEAWKNYWKRVNSDFDSGIAIWEMVNTYGGVARKSARPELNGIYLDTFNYINDLICAEVENDATVA